MTIEMIDFFPHISSFPPPPTFQDTTLALWIPCAVFSAVEAGLSVWCFMVGLALRGLPPCRNNYIKEQVCVFVWDRWMCLKAVTGVCLSESLCDSNIHTHTWSNSEMGVIHVTQPHAVIL